MARLPKRAVLSGTLFFALASSVLAQHRGRHHLHHHGQLPAYDPASEVTIEGDIAEMILMKRPGCDACDEGTHVLLSGTEAEIHMGPTTFLESKGCELQEGDRIRVTGSKLSIRGSDVVLAKELQCGDDTVVLRDEDGRPMWRRSSAKRR